MTKEDVEIVKELMQAGLPLLVFIFIVVLFIIYRKRIERFSTKITKIKGKIAGQEFETEIKEDKIEIINEKVIKSTVSEKVEDEKNIKNTMYHVWLQYDEHNIVEAVKMFEFLQKNEVDIEKKISNEIFHYYIKALNGNTNAKTELEEFAKTIKFDNRKFEAYEYLGLIYKNSRGFEKAIEIFDVALTLISSELNKVSIIKYKSDCYIELGQLNLAETIFIELSKHLIDDQSRCKNLENLGVFYKSQKKPFLQAVTLEKALQFQPDNTNILFSLAYAYSENNLNTMAVLHLQTLLFFKPKADYALNNIAVAYQNLGLRGKANQVYRSSYNKGNTLAAGNLVSNLIWGEFFDEAKEIINEVKKSEKYDDKINEVLDDLSKKEKNEKEKLEIILASAKIQERFFKRFHDYRLKSFDKKIDLIGEWELNNEVSVINLEGEYTPRETNTLNFSITDNRYNAVLTGRFDDVAVSSVIQYVDPKPGYSVLKRNSSGYAFLNSNLDEIEIMILLEDSNEIKEITLKRTNTES